MADDGNNSDLLTLIQESSALSPPEKEYWISLLPTMSPDQAEQLKKILTQEQDQLQKIDEKYDKKLEQISEKTLTRWDTEKVKAARLKRQAEEQVHREEEHSQAEELLKQF